MMDKILKQTIDHYGRGYQLNVAIEELSELIKELCKYKRGQGSEMHIAEEMADVKIILAELELIFDNKHRVNTWLNCKLQRLRDRMEEEERNHG